MYIRKVWIENVRGFGDDHRVKIDLERPGGKFAGWTVVAGRNGAGKSTFLKALALAVAGPTAARSLEASFLISPKSYSDFWIFRSNKS